MATGTGRAYVIRGLSAGPLHIVFAGPITNAALEMFPEHPAVTTEELQARANRRGNADTNDRWEESFALTKAPW